MMILIVSVLQRQELRGVAETLAVAFQRINWRWSSERRYGPKLPPSAERIENTVLSLWNDLCADPNERAIATGGLEVRRDGATCGLYVDHKLANVMGTKQERNNA
jgi:hypothetical protein